MSLKMYHSGTEIDGVVIKECPFCGNENLLVTEKDSYETLCEENGSSCMSIECRVCDTRKALYTIPENNYWIGIGMIISKWNVRCSYEDSSRD
jgi:hypothetical protein